MYQGAVLKLEEGLCLIEVKLDSSWKIPEKKFRDMTLILDSNSVYFKMFC